MYRKPAVAGTFYPADSELLKSEVDKYLKEAQSHLNGDENILALIAPHAGYIYSGAIAAESYKHLENIDFDLAIVLSPSHRVRFDGASIIPEGIYATPLGEVPIDSKIGEILVKERGFGFIDDIHCGEHALEVQIPFLQEVNKNFSLVPIVIGTAGLDTCSKIADGIYNVLKNESRKFIIIISTDLSHYHSYGKATAMDNKFIDLLQTYDEMRIFKEVQKGTVEACGIAPVITGICLTKLLGGKSIKTLRYANSGDTEGDKSEVVGYLAAAILE